MNEHLEVNENNLRAFLSSQSLETLTDSYLANIDIVSASVEDISDTLISVARLSATLHRMINGNFKSTSGNKVLIPSDRSTQNIVIQSYYEKTTALRTLFSNTDVRNAFINRMRELRKISQKPKEGYSK